jgi:putative ABC transport system ATP-binding protein
MIELHGIGREYLMGEERIRALRQVDLEILEGESVAIMGSSGSGKSTLLSILGCLDRPSHGSYRLDGRDVHALSKDQAARVRNELIGFVFQSFHLLPRATSWENVAQPLIYRGVAPARRRELAFAALERVGMGSRAHHLPNQLSGGQRQRVAIARALVGEPSVILADEPTGNLDSETTAEILDLFDTLSRQGATLVMVTHEIEVAHRCARIVRLRDGLIISDERLAPARASTRAPAPVAVASALEAIS